MRTRSAWDVTATIVLTVGAACIVLIGLCWLAVAYGDAFWWTAFVMVCFVFGSLAPSRDEPQAALVLPNLFQDRRPVRTDESSAVKRRLLIGAAVALAALVAFGVYLWATAGGTEPQGLNDLL